MEAIGLAGSLLLWAAAAAANARFARARRASLSPEWRALLDAQPGSDLRASSYLRLSLALTPWLAGLAVYVLLLSALGVLLELQLAAAVILALWWARRILAYNAYELAAMAEREGLEMPERAAGERIEWAASVYLIALAIVLAGCFAGRLLWELLA